MPFFGYNFEYLTFKVSFVESLPFSKGALAHVFLPRRFHGYFSLQSPELKNDHPKWFSWN
jgi:hypothetical protein